MADRAGVLPVTPQWKSEEEMSVCKPRPLPAEHRVLLPQPLQTDGQVSTSWGSVPDCWPPPLGERKHLVSDTTACVVLCRGRPGDTGTPTWVCLAEFTGNAGCLRGIDTGGPTRPPLHLGIPLFRPPGLHGQSSHAAWGDVEGRSTCVGGPWLCCPVPTTDRIRRQGQLLPPLQNLRFRGAPPVSPCKGSLALKVCRPQRTLRV